MAMDMRKAFNSRMMSPLTLSKNAPGSYDDDNNWVEGGDAEYAISGIIKGVKQSLLAMDGGARYSNYRMLYVKSDANVSVEDKIVSKGTIYYIAEQQNYQEFGYDVFLIEARS
jgi:hypothetical protein